MFYILHQYWTSGINKVVKIKISIFDCGKRLFIYPQMTTKTPWSISSNISWLSLFQFFSKYIFNLPITSTITSSSDVCKLVDKHWPTSEACNMLLMWCVLGIQESITSFRSKQHFTKCRGYISWFTAQSL